MSHDFSDSLLFPQINLDIAYEDNNILVINKPINLEVVGESLGGSRINIAQIDGISTNFSGDYPTLVVHNMDQPGHVAEVTSMLAHKSVNIAAMQLYRAGRGGNSVMVLECDQEVPEEGINWLRHAEGVVKVTYLGLE